ncbi:U3 small nucleolar ribonucleoprotein imp3 [Dimargaris xerosporica]|nr:U3 small nucleolar ribonucleoprotein imp3 [Dimargaris xerosporica]
MVRKLKYHEAKLLKKVNFLEYKNENNVAELEAIRRFNLKNREEYRKYAFLANDVQRVTYELSLLDPTDPYRSEQEKRLMAKLYDLGIIDMQTKVSRLSHLSVVSFCKRRLPVILCRLKMAQSVQVATKLVKDGHVRVGPEIVSDPAFLVSRKLEDFVTWVDTSSIKRHILKYNDKLDDFDLMN